MKLVKVNWENKTSSLCIANNTNDLFDNFDRFGDISEQNIEVYHLAAMSGILFKKEYEIIYEDENLLDKNDSDTYFANLIPQKESFYNLNNLQFKVSDFNYNQEGACFYIHDYLRDFKKSFYDLKNIDPLNHIDLMNSIISKKEEKMIFLEIENKEEVMISTVGSLFLSLQVLVNKYGSLDNLNINIKDADKMLNFLQDFNNYNLDKISCDPNSSSQSYKLFDLIKESQLLATINNNEVNTLKPHLKQINSSIKESFQYFNNLKMDLIDNTIESKNNFKEYTETFEKQKLKTIENLTNSILKTIEKTKYVDLDSNVQQIIKNVLSEIYKHKIELTCNYERHLITKDNNINENSFERDK